MLSIEYNYYNMNEIDIEQIDKQQHFDAASNAKMFNISQQNINKNISMQVENRLLHEQLKIQEKNSFNMMNQKQIVQQSPLCSFGKDKYKQTNQQNQNVIPLQRNSQSLIKNSNQFLSTQPIFSSRCSDKKYVENQQKQTNFQSLSKKLENQFESARNNKVQDIIYFFKKRMPQDQQTMIQLHQIRNLEQKMDRAQILYTIFQTAQRNQTYIHTNMGHFLIPFNMAMLALYSLNPDKEDFMMNIYFAILKKINRRKIKAQFSNKQDFQKYFKFLLQYEGKGYQEVIKMLIYFLRNQGGLMKFICPYYYNFFAFAVNTQIMYGGDLIQRQLEYTIQFILDNYDTLGSLNVQREIKKMEQMLVKKYHCKQI